MLRRTLTSHSFKAPFYNIQCAIVGIFPIVAVSWLESNLAVSSKMWKLRVAFASRRVLCLLNLLKFYTDCFGKWICFLSQIKTGKSLNCFIYFSFFSSYNSNSSETLKAWGWKQVKHPKCCVLFGETHKPNHDKGNGGETSSEPFRINPEQFLM